MASPSILLILSCFMSVTHLQAALVDPPTYCSSSCGDIKNISYPFRLSTDPHTCGDADYELSCDASNRTLIPFLDQTYYVTHIFPQNSTIRLVDPKLASGNCGLPSRSVSFDEIDFRFAGSWYSSSVPSVSFVNCTANVSDPRYVRVPCLSGSGSGTGSVYVAYDEQTYSALKPSCSFVAKVLVLRGSPKNGSYEAVVDLLGSGFDLEYSVVCRDCVRSGGSCFYGSVNWSELGYHCERGNYVIKVMIPAVAPILRSLMLGKVK